LKTIPHNVLGKEVEAKKTTLASVQSPPCQRRGTWYSPLSRLSQAGHRKGDARVKRGASKAKKSFSSGGDVRRRWRRRVSYPMQILGVKRSQGGGRERSLGWVEEKSGYEFQNFRRRCKVILSSSPTLGEERSLRETKEEKKKKNYFEGNVVKPESKNPTVRLP